MAMDCTAGKFWPLVGHEHKDVTTQTNGFGDVQIVGGHDSLFCALADLSRSDRRASARTTRRSSEALIPVLQPYPLAKLRDSTSTVALAVSSHD